MSNNIKFDNEMEDIKPITFPSKDEQKNFINNGYKKIIQPETASILALREYLKSFKFIY